MKGKITYNKLGRETRDPDAGVIMRGRFRLPLVLPVGSVANRVFWELVGTIGEYLCLYAADGAILFGLRRFLQILNAIASPKAMAMKPTIPIAAQSVFPFAESLALSGVYIGVELFERFVVVTGVIDGWLDVPEVLVNWETTEKIVSVYPKCFKLNQRLVPSASATETLKPSYFCRHSFM